MRTIGPPRETTPGRSCGSTVGAPGSAFAAGRYTDAARLLPPVAHTAQRVPGLVPVLVQGYVLASEIATKTNDNGLAWVAADRALTAAGATDDPTLIALATQRVSTAMRRDGHTAGALTLLTRAVDTLAGPGTLPLRGTLLLVAAYTAAVAEDRSEAVTLLGEAESIARRAPRSTRFNQPVVAGYAISVHTALGSPSRALNYAATEGPGPTPVGLRALAVRAGALV